MGLISRLFGKSPFGALTKHSIKVHECVKLVRPLMETFLKGEYDKIDPIHHEIARFEHEADIIKTEIRQNIGKYYFLSVEKTDLLHFLHTEDEIADAAEDIAVLCEMRKTKIPASLNEDLLHYVDLAIETSEKLLQAAQSMDHVVESAFGGPETEKVLREIQELNKKEWEVDKASRQLLKKMFELEDEMKTLDVVFCMKILREIGRMANHAENTGEHLALMILRR